MIRALVFAIALLVAAPTAALGPYTATVQPSTYFHDTSYAADCGAPAYVWDGYPESTKAQCTTSTSSSYSTAWTVTSAQLSAAIPADATLSSVVWYVHYSNSGSSGGATRTCTLEYASTRSTIASFSVPWSTAWTDATVSMGAPAVAVMRGNGFNVVCKGWGHTYVNPGYFFAGDIHATITYTIPDPAAGTVVFVN